jgi:predicted MFS family arabinose efflux permease
MRWLTLLAAGPGALLGGWLGEHVGLRSALGFAAGVSLLLAAGGLALPLIRELRSPAQARIAKAIGWATRPNRPS